MKKVFKLIIFLLFILIQPCFGAGERVNVAFTIDNNYPIFTLITINSILLNNSSNSDYHFFIVENNLTNKNKQKMEDFVKKRNQEISFIKINEPLIKKEIYKYTEHITSIAFARIFLPDLLPKDVSRVIYLDSDLVVTSDLKELYDTDLKGQVAGISLNDWDVYGDGKLYKFKNGYYNTGVILFDIEKARKENSSKIFQKYYLENIDKFTYTKEKADFVFLLPDQDLINIVWDGKITPIGKKWNQQQSNLYKGGIIHYIGENKPWAYKKSDEVAKVYFDYWDKTPELKKYKYYYFLKSIKDKIVSACKIVFKFGREPISTKQIRII